MKKKITKKMIEERAQQILDMDPEERHRQTQRMLAERIAYYELKAEEADAGKKDAGSESA